MLCFRSTTIIDIQKDRISLSMYVVHTRDRLYTSGRSITAKVEPKLLLPRSFVPSFLFLDLAAHFVIPRDINVEFTINGDSLTLSLADFVDI